MPTDDQDEIARERPLPYVVNLRCGQCLRPTCAVPRLPQHIHARVSDRPTMTPSRLKLGLGKGTRMQSVDVRHRLLVILAADAAGYSRLMALDDVASLSVLHLARRVFETQIKTYGGRLIDTAGDSVLAVFDTASGAVSAAMATQEEIATQFDGAPQDRRMLFRIGIHLGDVLEKGDGTVYGDGVNIAARLQALAQAGGIAISQAVHGAVSHQLNAAFEDIGQQVLKNIATPVRAFRLPRAEQRPHDVAGRSTHAAPSRQLCQPPMRNNPRQRYLRRTWRCWGVKMNWSHSRSY